MKIRLSMIVLIALCLTTKLTAAAVPVVIPDVNLSIKKTASNHSENVQNAVISRKKIKTGAAALFSDLLTQEQSVVRVINNTNDNSRPALSIRGFGDNAFANSLIIIDGFPLTNPSALAPSMNGLSLLDISRVELFSGSQGSLWGNQAVGGTVKITTLHPEKPIANAALSYGSYNKKLYSLLIGNKFDNGFFFKLIEFSNQTDNYRYHNQQSDQGIALQSGLDYSSGSLTFNIQRYDDRINLPGGLTQAQYEANPRQASNNRNFSQFKTDVYQLMHKQAINNNWTLETRLAHNRIQGKAFIYGLGRRQDLSDSFNPALTGSLFNNKILLGYEGQISRFQIESAHIRQKASSQQNDLYARITVPFFKQLDFALGGRSVWQTNAVVRNSKNLSENNAHQIFVSEQTLTYHPAPEWDVFVRRDGNFRLPKANELTNLPVQLSPLLPQTGVSYEMGAKWQTPQQTAQISVYQLPLNHEIAFDPTQTASAPYGSYSNFDKTQRSGIALAEQRRLTDKLLVEGQLNYVDARFAGGIHKNRQIPAVPAVSGNLGLSYLFKPHWQAKYNAFYTGSRYASQDTANAGEKLCDYWVSALTLQYLHKSFSVSASVENLFNQRYAAYTFYNARRQTDDYYPAAGRNFLLTIKVFLE